MDYAVAQMGGVAAGELTDGLQFDVAESGRLEQPPSIAQQHGDEVQFEFVELAGGQQRLCRTRAMHQYGSISRRFAGLDGARVDVGVELRAARWLVGRVDVVGEHVDRHAVVWSPFHRPASSNVRRPEITAPVEQASAYTCPLIPSDIRSSSQLNSRPPSRPSSWPGRSSGPAMYPSTDMDMYSRSGVLPILYSPSADQSAADMPSAWPTGH